MIYDAVICVAPQHQDISLKAIRSLQQFSSPRKIYIITARTNFCFFINNLENNCSIQLIDEDNVIEGVSLSSIREYLTIRIRNTQRAGWYFQQFLKMSICSLAELAEYYLVWDSDTIALQRLSFFDRNNRVLVSHKNEYHPPYFELINKLLDLERHVKFSFISEHFMIEKSYMNELVGSLMSRSAACKSWVWLVLDTIEDRNLGDAGFSEYETYGNFVANKYPNSFQARWLKSTRFGAARFGMAPNQYDLFRLRWSGYYLATFEVWDAGLPPLVAVNKLISTSLYKVCFAPARLMAGKLPFSEK